MQRRGFLKTLVALAATAVAGPALAALAPNDRERLIEQMKTGYISGQTFLLHEPVTFAIEHLQIRDCMFIFDFKEPAYSAIEIASNRILLHGCMFNTKDSPVECIISCNGSGTVMNNIFLRNGPPANSAAHLVIEVEKSALA